MIDSISHISSPLDKVNEFSKNVYDSILKHQSAGLEVEIQYQHTVNGFSALIIGRKQRENEKCHTPITKK
jgi:hypothetical protein